MSLSETNSELLGVEDAAQLLGATPLTVQWWCRDGVLPCLRIGRSWCIRRSVLEEHLGRSERPQALVGTFEPFFEIPDNVLAIWLSESGLASGGCCRHLRPKLSYNVCQQGST